MKKYEKVIKLNRSSGKFWNLHTNFEKLIEYEIFWEKFSPGISFWIMC